MPAADSEPCAIGLDVGGTKIAGGVVTPSGQVLARRRIPTNPERGGEAVLSVALEIAGKLMAEAEMLDREVLGIGVGAAELVDPEGNVTSEQTISWRGMPVRERFSRLAPAVVDSDVRTAALAEAVFGAGRPFDPLVYVAVGTGISSCLVQSGRPYAGARGNALVLAGGPVSAAYTGEKAKMSPPALLEEFASGPALVNRYNRLSSLHVECAESVLAAVDAGDPVAIEVVSTASEALGTSVGWLVNVLDPEAVIVGGGLGLAGGLYWSGFISSARDHIWAEQGRNLPLLPAALGNDAGFVGAGATVLQKKPGINNS